MSKVFEFSQEHPKTNPGFDETQEGDNMTKRKPTAEEIEVALKGTSPVDFTEPAEVELPAEVREFKHYEPMITGANVLERNKLLYSKADGVTPVGLDMNFEAKYGSPRILADRDEDGKMVLDLAKAGMNLIAHLLDGYYYGIFPGVAWKVDPEEVNYMTFKDNALYADGTWLVSNGFGEEFNQKGFYVGNIHRGAYSFRELFVVKYVKERVAELRTTAEGIKQADLEDADRKMVAKFIVGQFMVAGARHAVFPVFFRKDDEENWKRDAAHLEHYMKGFEASFSGDANAKANGHRLYQNRATVGSLVTIKAQIAIGALPTDGIMVKVQRGSEIVVEAAASLPLGQKFELGRKGVRVKVDETLAFARLANSLNIALIPVEA